ncbi:hypothetical protein N3P16_01600, partial [Treponema pallidum]
MAPAAIPLPSEETTPPVIKIKAGSIRHECSVSMRFLKGSTLPLPCACRVDCPIGLHRTLLSNTMGPMNARAALALAMVFTFQRLCAEERFVI